MSFTPGSGAVISVGVDGAAASRRDIDSVGDSLRRLNESNFQKLSGQVSAMQGHFTSLKSTMGDIVKFSVAGFTVGAFTEMIKGSIDAADNLNDLSKTTGIAVDNLSGLKLAAQQSGGDLDGIANLINKLSVNMGKDADRFKRLGVTAKDPLEAFKQLSDVFSAIEDLQLRAALGAEALGKGWASAAPLLSEGGKKIGEMVDKGKALSGMTQDAANLADEFNDRMAEMQTAVSGAKVRLVSDMLPALTQVTTAVTQALTESGKLQAVWVALGALGAFAFTDEFSSATIKIENLKKKLDDLYIAKNIAEGPGGLLLAKLIGTPADFDERISSARGKLKALQDQIDKPAKDAAAKAKSDAQAKADAGAATAASAAAAFVKAGEAASKAALAANLETVQTAVEVDKNKRAEGLTAVAELNRQGLATDAQYYVAKYNAALASGTDIAKVKSADISVLSKYHATDLADQIATNGKISKLNSEKNEALRSSLVSAAQIRAQYIYDSNAPVRAAQAAADGEIDAVNKEVVALQAQYESYGKLPAAITAATIAKLQARAAALEANEGSEAEIANTNRLIAALQAKAAMEGKVTAQDKGSDLTRANELLNVMSALDDAARQAAAGMADAFGSVGTAIGGMSTAMTGFARNQAAIAAQLVSARENAHGVSAKIHAAEQHAAEATSQAQIQQYGDMAHAAASFFDKNSNGYKIMHTAEQAFRAYEMAMAMESMVKKIFFKEGEVAANLALNGTKLVGEATTTAASTGLAATEASAWGVTAVVKALASLPFPLNLAAGAATLAAVVAVGTKIVGSFGSGSGGGQSAADVQKAQGTGGVFGDSSAKSDSIARAISLSSANSSIELTHTAGMLASLQNIEASMAGLTNLIVRAPGVIDGSNFGIQTGQLNKGQATDVVSSAMTSVTKGLFGPGLGDKISGFINNIWGKTTQNIVDSGLQFGGSVRNLEAGQGYNQYASVDTTKSGWFGLSKNTSNSVQTQGVDAELSSQFGLIFTNLEDSLKTAAAGLGVGADQVTKALDNLTIDTTKLSLKGLSGDALTAALNGAISKTMDQMAEAAFPSFDTFRKVGEGYAETVIRVATNYSKLDSILQSAGMTFGAVGVSSLAARENLIDLSGGIDALASKTNSFTQNYLSTAEQLAPVSKYVADQMAALGHASVNTRDQFKAVVVGIDKKTAAGQAEFVALMNLEDAFAKTHAATEDLTKSMQEIADEHKDLQKQYNDLTMTSTQLRDKERESIDKSNLALFDAVTAERNKAAAVTTANNLLDIQAQIYSATGDKARTAAVLEKQHIAALAAMDPALRDATKQLWSIQAAAARQASWNAAFDSMATSLQSVMDKAKESAKALRDYRDSLVGGNLSPLSEDDKTTALKRQFETADADHIKDAASAYLAAAQATSASQLDYLRVFASVQAKLSLAATGQDDRAKATNQFALNLPAILSAAGIGAHANGGIAAGLSLVGEQGPELVNFSEPARVYTAGQTRSMLSGGSNDALKAEMKLMREQLTEALQVIAAHTKRGADSSQVAANALDGAANGIPLTMETA
jgi:hypothetical protein